MSASAGQVVVGCRARLLPVHRCMRLASHSLPWGPHVHILILPDRLDAPAAQSAFRTQSSRHGSAMVAHSGVFQRPRAPEVIPKATYTISVINRVLHSVPQDVGGRPQPPAHPVVTHGGVCTVLLCPCLAQPHGLLCTHQFYVALCARGVSSRPWSARLHLQTVHASSEPFSTAQIHHIPRYTCIWYSHSCTW
jgi:hypothetical protein